MVLCSGFERNALDIEAYMYLAENSEEWLLS
jgi:hypothetical protein